MFDLWLFQIYYSWNEPWKGLVQDNMITVMRGCNSVYKLGKIAVMEKKMSSVMFVAVRNLIIVINGITRRVINM